MLILTLAIMAYLTYITKNLMKDDEKTSSPAIRYQKTSDNDISIPEINNNYDNCNNLSNNNNNGNGIMNTMSTPKNE